MFIVLTVLVFNPLIDFEQIFYLVIVPCIPLYVGISDACGDSENALILT